MFSDPKANVAALGVSEGMRVADFGAGSGAYALELGRRVGITGRVYAVEVQKDLLERLGREAKAARLANVHLVWGNVERSGGSTLADASVDLVVVANVLFLSDARYSLALEAKRILRPESRVAVIDWSTIGSPPGSGRAGIGPDATHVITPAEAERIMAEAGLTKVREFGAGPHHWGLIFQKPR